jgi:hypothetical protein
MGIICLIGTSQYYGVMEARCVYYETGTVQDTHTAISALHTFSEIKGEILRFLTRNCVML